MATLLLLSLAALVASVGITLRIELAGRAERAAATLTLWHALVLAPVYALGLTDRLYRTTLGVTAGLFFAAAWALSFVGARPRAHLRDTWRELGSLAAMPADALAMAWRARSFTLVGVAVSVAVIAWSFVATYVAQSDSWDGMGYHEPMVGYALQNHGFTPVSVPRLVFYEAVNGLPRHCEMIALWLCAFVDRRLIELPNTLATPLFLLGVYLLCRRFGATRDRALGWSTAAFLMPGAVLLLRSTYIDMVVAAFDLAAVHFCTRPGFRTRDGWLAAVAGALMIGSKTMNIAWGPPLLVAAAVLMVMRGRNRPAALVGTLLGGVAIVVALGLPIYLRNLVVYKSPMWPWGFDFPKLGLHFPGIQLASEAAAEQKKPIDDVWRNIISPFHPGYDYVDTRVYGYGISTPFLLLPLSILSAVVGALHVARAAVARLVGARPPRASEVMFGLFALYFAGCGVFSPAIWQARYNLHVLAAVVIGTSWLCETYGWRRFADGLVAATIFANLVYLGWADPGLVPGPTKIAELLRMSPAQRAATRHIEWTIEDRAALVRETQLDGRLSVYTSPINFIGSQWNDRFSNRVEHWAWQAPETFLAELDRRQAHWVTTRAQDSIAAALRQSPKWREVGMVSFLDAAFVRVETPPAGADAGAPTP